MIVDVDVRVRRANGDRCFLSALTGSRAVVVLAESLRELAPLFPVPARAADEGALVLGVQQLGAGDATPAPEVVFDDDRAIPGLLPAPATPAAFLVSGLRSLGPAVTSPDQIRRLLARARAEPAARVSGALHLGDLVG